MVNNIFTAYAQRLLLTAVLLILLGSMSYAQMPKLDIQTKTFKVGDQQYMELYTGLLESSLCKKDLNKKFKGCHLLYVMKYGEDVVWANKTNLIADLDQETDMFGINRILVKPGAYDLTISAVDIQDSLRRKSVVQKVSIHDWVKQPVVVSDIQLISNLTPCDASKTKSACKQGYIMEPLKFNYFNQDMKAIKFYFETYMNDMAGMDSNYILYHHLSHVDDNGQIDTLIKRYKRKVIKSVDAAMNQEVILDDWPSGKYTIEAGILDMKLNSLSRNKTSFVVNNGVVDQKELDSTFIIEKTFVAKLTEEEVDYSLRALGPKVNPEDVGQLNTLISRGELEAKRNFLYRYWIIQNNVLPKEAYDSYMAFARTVDKEYYGAFGRGFETDRGYMMLKYNRPNDIISIENESTAPPYEIWTYNYFPATDQHNVKFVFYNPSLAPNQYELLHSNCRGELNDPQWLFKLYRNSPQDREGNAIDGTEVKDYWNRQAAEIFSDN